MFAIFYWDIVVIIYFDWNIFVNFFWSIKSFYWNILFVLITIRRNYFIFFLLFVLFFLDFGFLKFLWFQKSGSHIFSTSYYNNIVIFIWNVSIFFELEMFQFNIILRFDNWDVCDTCNFNNICRFILWRNIICCFFL